MHFLEVFLFFFEGSIEPSIEQTILIKYTNLHPRGKPIFALFDFLFRKCKFNGIIISVVLVFEWNPMAKHVWKVLLGLSGSWSTQTLKYGKKLDKQKIIQINKADKQKEPYPYSIWSSMFSNFPSTFAIQHIPVWNRSSAHPCLCSLSQSAWWIPQRNCAVSTMANLSEWNWWPIPWCENRLDP